MGFLDSNSYNFITYFIHVYYNHNTIILTICGDLAINEGHLLEEKITCKPIIALSKTKIATYEGI